MNQYESDLRGVRAGNVSPIGDAAGRLMDLVSAARPVQVERTRRLETLTDQAERDAGELEALRDQLERCTRRIDEDVSRVAALREELAVEKRENARLRRENQQAAQRAFFLQPGLRVQLPGGREGTTIDERVQASVLLDGHQVAVRVDTRHLRYLAPAPARVTVDGVDIGTARNVRLTSLEPDGTPLPYPLQSGEAIPAVPAAHFDPPSTERPPFHHEPGSASDYLEALAEEVENGPRRPVRMETMAAGHVLKIQISFDVPDRRGELSDLLYVANKDRP